MSFNHENPKGGEKLLTSYLVSKGIRIRRSKLRVLVKEHDINYEERKKINSNFSPPVGFSWLKDIHLEVENGKIYDWKTNNWVSVLEERDLVSEVDKYYHLVTDNPRELEVTIYGIEVNHYRMLGVLLCHRWSY